MAPSTGREARSIFMKIRTRVGRLQNVQTVVCPPTLFIRDLARVATGHRCVVGAQDMYWDHEGAHTGETSPNMLIDAKVKYVIIGHSERRERGETDIEVGRKVKTALSSGLTPVVCVGERIRDDGGTYIRLIRKQVTEALRSVTRKDAGKVVFAYEPIWAIGKKAKRPATPEDVEEISIYIQKTLTLKYGAATAARVCVLYGGSVNETNASSFMETGSVDGLLIGRASLDPEKFSKIAHDVNALAS